MTAHGKYELDVEALYIAIDQKRRRDRISWNELARRSGVAWNTYYRMGRYNMGLTADNLVNVLMWLNETDLQDWIIEK